MSAGPEAENILKGEVQSSYYWAWQNNELSSKIEISPLHGLLTAAKRETSTAFLWTPTTAENQAAPSSRSFNTDVYVARSC